MREVALNAALSYNAGENAGNQQETDSDSCHEHSLSTRVMVRFLLNLPLKLHHSTVVIVSSLFLWYVCIPSMVRMHSVYGFFSFPRSV
jgi:hypothetical protein